MSNETMKRVLVVFAEFIMLVAMALLITAVVLPKWLVFDTSVGGVVVEIGLFEACVPGQDQCFTYEQLGLGGSIIAAVTALSITAIVLMFGALIFGLLVIIKQKPAMAIAAGITGMFACLFSLIANILFAKDVISANATDYYGASFYLANSAMFLSVFAFFFYFFSKPPSEPIHPDFQ